MKKRLLAGILSCVMALSLLPVSAFASTGVAGVANVYTLADIKTATEDHSVTTIRLMNDIDVNKEDYEFDRRSVDAPVYCTADLRSDVVFEGNGHTVYNLKSGIWAYNEGTIRNLNISIHDTESDSRHLSDYGSATYGREIEYFGIAEGNAGTIENCNVTMKISLEDQRRLYIGGITLVNKGTIRDCIVNLPVDITVMGDLSGVEVGGIARYTHENSLIDHCLVLGHLNASGNRALIALVGIASLNKDARCVDSAFAMDEVEVSGQREYYFSPGFETWMGSVEGAENCRVANDIPYKHTVTNSDPGNSHPAINEGGTLYAGEGCTLASRSSILKDWDTSQVPAETPPTDIPVHTPDPEPAPTTPTETADAADPYPEGDVWFRYSASGGGVKQHSFHYDSDYFNKNGAFQIPLAVASLCLELSAWSDNLNLAWNSTQNSITPARATNILELYGKLGFTNAKCVNYDVPLTDTSDKVAFSMAMKYIDNGKGGTDTLVAVPIRGGGYGGEWGSNFHVTYDWTYSQYVNHLGFESAAKKAKMAVQEYLDSQDIKGDVKIWLVGYSRGAAVANMLGHYLAEEATPGGIRIQRKNLYAYTFATPAGVSETYMDDSDTNIFNFVSPVDIVPMVAPAQWGFGRYGQTIQLTTNFSHAALEKFRLLSGYTDVDIQLTIGSSHQTEINLLMDWLCGLVPDAGNFYQSGLQITLVNGIGQLEGRNPAEKAEEKVAQQTAKQLEQVASYAIKAVQAVSDPAGVLISSGVKWTVKDFISKRIKYVGLAHCPELYLTWLEMSTNKMLDALEKAAEKKQLVIQEPNVNVRFWNKSSGTSAGSYVSGVCSSGEVEVEKTDLGLVATFPAGKDYSFTVSGTGASNSVSFTVFTYDNDSIGQFAAASQFTDLPLDGGRSYTVTVDEDPYEEAYAVDQSGKYYAPDDGTPRVNFTDVPANAYFHDAVEWAVEEGITSGTTAVTFSPYNACTRAQVVTFLWRAAGCPEPESSYTPFVDVPANAYYHDAVLWAAEEGITTGVTASRFNPNATVTRGQTVTFLWRWDGEPEADRPSSFRDVAASAYYSKAVSWAVEAGITKGTTAAAFSPNQTCTRAQIVTFLYRDLMPETDYED